MTELMRRYWKETGHDAITFSNMATHFTDEYVAWLELQNTLLQSQLTGQQVSENPEEEERSLLKVQYSEKSYEPDFSDVTALMAAYPEDLMSTDSIKAYMAKAIPHLSSSYLFSAFKNSVRRKGSRYRDIYKQERCWSMGSKRYFRKAHVDDFLRAHITKEILSKKLAERSTITELKQGNVALDAQEKKV